MWSQPVEHVAPDGQRCSLVLLDTEGIDAYDQTGQYSTQIFSLAVLLSSVFVYNQMGGIDEAALDRLALVTEMTKHIRVRSQGERPEEVAAHTPSFLWLLRDFYLDLEEDFGSAGTARDYLETALSLVPGAGSAVEAKNAIRRSIKTLFPDRDCVTLVRPHADERKLRKLEEVDPRELRPEFREGMEALLENILGKAHPKSFQGCTLTGPVLAALVGEYVGAINDGAVPTIATAWQGVSEVECRKAVEDGHAEYRQAFDEASAGDGGEVPATEEALRTLHEKALAAARLAFEARAVGDEGTRRTMMGKMAEKLEQHFQEVCARRFAEARAECQEFLADAGSEVLAYSRQEGTEFRGAVDIVDNRMKEYDAKMHGPSKCEMKAKFLRGHLVHAAEQALDRQAVAAQTAADALRLGAERAGLKLEAAEERCAHALRQHESSAKQIDKLSGEVRKLTHELGKANLQAQRIDVDRAKGSHELKNILHDLEASKSKCARVQEELLSLQNDRSEISRERAGLLREKADNTARFEALRAKLAETEAGAAVREQELSAKLKSAPTPMAVDMTRQLQTWQAEATAAAAAASPVQPVASPTLSIPSPSPTPEFKAPHSRTAQPFAPVENRTPECPPKVATGGRVERAKVRGAPRLMPFAPVQHLKIDFSSLTVRQLRQKLMDNGLKQELLRLGSRAAKADLVQLCETNIDPIENAC
jgi:predicted  nucleic acid-binding Zn-ribbon protein